MVSVVSQCSSPTRSVIRSTPPPIAKRKPRKVCILSETDARTLTYAGIAHKCSSRRHHHYTQEKVDGLVKAGELVWLGKHKKFATFQNARSWAKVYTRNAAGEVLCANMQLVRGGGGW
jgi:hypothetical protein